MSDTPALKARMTTEEIRAVPTLTIPETAAALGLSVSGAYAAAKSGEIATVRIGSRLLVPTRQLLALLGIESD